MKPLGTNLLSTLTLGALGAAVVMLLPLEAVGQMSALLGALGASVLGVVAMVLKTQLGKGLTGSPAMWAVVTAQGLAFMLRLLALGASALLIKDSASLTPAPFVITFFVVSLAQQVLETRSLLAGATVKPTQVISMKRLVLILVASFAAPVLAAHEEHVVDPNAPVDQATKNRETSEFILHHVADDTEFELEIPFPPYHLPAVHIAEAFEFLKIERVPGACAGHAPAGFESFPSLGLFLHGCWDLRPTKAILMMWLATAILFGLLFLGRKRDQNGVPKGLLAHLVETFALFVRDEIAVPNLGREEGKRYTPYLVSLFFFILAMNWLALIPGMFAATGVMTVTAALAVLSFILTQIAGIRSAGLGGYLKHLTGGVPPFLWIIMIPVEVLGLFTKPFALLIRLFANMLGGHLVVFFLLALIFMWTPGAAAVALPLTVAIFCLEIFVGILQAYLFTLLTSLFIGQGVAMGHHAHGDDHAH